MDGGPYLTRRLVVLFIVLLAPGFLWFVSEKAGMSSSTTHRLFGPRLLLRRFLTNIRFFVVSSTLLSRRMMRRMMTCCRRQEKEEALLEEKGMMSSWRSLVVVVVLM